MYFVGLISDIILNSIIICSSMLDFLFIYCRYPELLSLLESPYTVLLYPDSNSVDIESLPTDQTYNLIVLDGTWLQAKAIYSKNKFLHGIKKVCVIAKC